MSTIDSRSIALGEEGCSTELTEEDKALIRRLVSLEFFGDKSEYSEYKCEQKCSICSENKPHYPPDESLLHKLHEERKAYAFLSIEDREAINKDLIHKYFKKMWEVKSKKMKNLQPETTNTDSDISKCTNSNRSSVIFSNEKKASSILHDNPIPIDFEMSYEVETETFKKTNNEMAQTENEYIKMEVQEEVSRYKHVEAEKKSTQIHCNQSTLEKSNTSMKLQVTRTENTKGKRQHILSSRNKEENECKNKPNLATQKDKHDEKAERLKRMKASWNMALANQGKSKGLHSSTTLESKSQENANNIKVDVGDKREGNMIELLAETSRKQIQAPIKKSKDKNDRDKTDPPFNGKPMDDPKGKYYINRESVDVQMYQEGLKNDKWNPTQCLNEISAKCGWTWPLFTVSRLDKTSLIPSYICEVIVNGENFTTDEGVAQKKFAQHTASAKILKYIGFDFEYQCKKI